MSLTTRLSKTNTNGPIPQKRSEREMFEIWQQFSWNLFCAHSLKFGLIIGTVTHTKYDNFWRTLYEASERIHVFRK
jgi:hypothetical protein